jgi:hypothetical protein
MDSAAIVTRIRITPAGCGALRGLAASSGDGGFREEVI